MELSNKTKLEIVGVLENLSSRDFRLAAWTAKHRIRKNPGDTPEEFLDTIISKGIEPLQFFHDLFTDLHLMLSASEIRNLAQADTAAASGPKAEPVVQPQYVTLERYEKDMRQSFSERAALVNRVQELETELAIVKSVVDRMQQTVQALQASAAPKPQPRKFASAGPNIVIPEKRSRSSLYSVFENMSSQQFIRIRMALIDDQLETMGFKRLKGNMSNAPVKDIVDGLYSANSDRAFEAVLAANKIAYG
ncbi:hypothetical protein LMBV_025 [Largemouth bass virus]|uniref:Uncharacterized protein n=1 Tax=Largemouth bass virus TaxID=176656 RepID=A0A9X7TNR3_9VIRU|nr:hypothetical protein OA88_22870 [Flavobacterium sp. JRM]QJE49088.1 hypothetical protein LMBV_025 [Largemouth bass virus]QJE49174.1 hypothetical protein LMBV_025 [Largemouth bass virus]